MTPDLLLAKDTYGPAQDGPKKGFCRREASAASDMDFRGG